jgi:large subunit ribosomal protein L6
VSRIGKLPVPIPSGVKAELNGLHLKVTGPKGTLEQDFRPEIQIAMEDGAIVVRRPDEKKPTRALHGLTRALINNMVQGVSQGYERTLLIEGVGYRAALQGKTLNLQLGYSHPVSVDPPDGIAFAVEGTQTIKVSGFDKQLVGQVSADIRKLRKPEPYKGKGIRYSDEKIRRKVGKAGGK